MQFSLLGPLRVTTDDGPLDLGGPRQRTVLAILLLRFGRQVQTEDLIDLVWGEEPPASVRTSLHSYISRLRKLLGADRIERRAGGYALLADLDEVDAALFERLVREARSSVDGDAAGAVRLYARAEDLWRGPAVADLRDELGLRPDATRLDELRLSAVEERVAAELMLARHAELLPRLELLVDRHPERETLWQHLMLALYRSGRQAEALDAYKALRTELAEQFGIDPSPRTAHLHRRILQHDESLDLVGEPLRGYRLLEPIGRGSVGLVYRAVQPQVDRPVAVKVIDATLADDPAFIRRFETQARRIARLEHPHIAPIHDYWREPGGAYLVTPLFEGGSLADALEGGGLPDVEVMGLVEQVASAISFAHRQGVVHGNLHAGNVLLDRDGNAYVADFAAGLHGLAAGTSSRAGTWHMAPEVAGGAPSTPLSDVFSLGRLVIALAVARADDRLLEVGRRATATDPATRPGAVDELLRDLVGLGDTGQNAANRFVRNPYKGLRSFQTEDEGDYFGRADLVEHITARLTAGDRFLAIVGPSGSGKSSLVRAGVIPALFTSTLGGVEEWFVADVVPGPHPFEKLNEALRAIAVSPDWMPLSVANHDLLAALGRALPGTDAPVLLVIDQFEEVFTVADDDEREAFIASLASAVTATEGRVRVLVTMRADHYDRPLEHAAIAQLTIGGSIGVPPMSAEELGAAIAGPAEGVGVEVEPALIARLTADLASQPNALPMLQYALTEMFDHRRGGALDVHAYREVGGLTGALTLRAERAWSGLSDRARAAAPQVLLRLVALSDAVATRRRATQRELTEATDDPAVADELLDELGGARLLAFDRDPVTREPTVEVAHEALMHGWDRLASWIDDARQDLVQHDQLTRAATEWDAAGRDTSYLATGTRLAQLDSWQRATTRGLTSTERDFLDGSTQARDHAAAAAAHRDERERALERRANRRLRATVAVLAVSALLGAVLSGFAIDQRDEARRQARIATARELAAAAVAATPLDAQRGLLLALEAVRMTRNAGEEVLPEAEAALRQAVAGSRLAATLTGIGGHVAVSPDGRLVITEGAENTGLIDVRDVATGEVLTSFVGHEESLNDRPPDLNAVAFSRDGSMVATAGDDGTLRVWGDVWASGANDPELVVRGDDAESLQPGEEFSDVWGPAFSPDGRFVAAAWRAEGRVRVADVDSGELVLDVAVPNAAGVDFSPDGSHLAVVSRGRGGQVLSTQTGDVVFEFGAGEEPYANAISYSPDGLWLATTSGPNVVIRDADTGDTVEFTDRDATLTAAAPALDVAWSPDSRQIAAGDGRGRAHVWRIDPAKAEISRLHEFADANGPISGIAFTPDGNRLVAGAEGGLDSAATWVWDLGPAGTGQLLLRLDGPGPPPTVGATFTAAGELAVISGGARTISGFDVSEPGPVDPFSPSWTIETDPENLHQDPHWVQDPQASPAGDLIAWGEGGSAAIWDLAEGQQILRPEADSGLVDVAWTPDGSHVALGGIGAVHVFELDGRRQTTLPITGPDGEPQRDFRTRVAFSSDGGLLAIGGAPDIDGRDGRVELWDWRAQALVAVLEASSVLPAFSPDGSWLAVGGSDDVIELFDTATRQRIGMIPSGPFESLAMAVSPDGRTIAAGGGSGVVRLWDVESRSLRLELLPHETIIWSLDFSPDGSRLVSTDEHGEVRVVTLDIDELIEQAQAELLRGFTDDECRRYLRQETCDDPKV